MGRFWRQLITKSRQVVRRVQIPPILTTPSLLSLGIMANSNVNSSDSTKAVQSFPKCFVEVDDGWDTSACSSSHAPSGPIRKALPARPGMFGFWYLRRAGGERGRGSRNTARGCLVRTRTRTRMGAALRERGARSLRRPLLPRSSRVAASAVLQMGFSSSFSKLLYFTSSKYLCWLNRM